MFKETTGYALNFSSGPIEFGFVARQYDNGHGTTGMVSGMFEECKLYGLTSYEPWYPKWVQPLSSGVQPDPFGGASNLPNYTISKIGVEMLVGYYTPPGSETPLIGYLTGPTLYPAGKAPLWVDVDNIRIENPTHNVINLNISGNPYDGWEPCFTGMELRDHVQKKINTWSQMGYFDDEKDFVTVRISDGT